MKPVDQDLFGDGKGNCFAACVASVLEMPIKDVPNFCEGWDMEWFAKFLDWLAGRGLSAVELWVTSDWKPNPGQVCILSGKSPRGDFDHAVVGEWTGEEFRITHDPHPSRAGLKGKFLQAAYFIPLDPARYLEKETAGDS